MVDGGAIYGRMDGNIWLNESKQSNMLWMVQQYIAGNIWWGGWQYMAVNIKSQEAIMVAVFIE